MFSDFKGARSSVAATGSKSSKAQAESKKKEIIDPVTVLQQDWREYECKTWHLEPTVRYGTFIYKNSGVGSILQEFSFWPETDIGFHLAH